MLKGGFLIYKCRMCGEEYSNTHAPDIQLCLISIITGNDSIIQQWSGIIPIMLDLHCHSDGTDGIGDLIGGRQDTPGGNK